MKAVEETNALLAQILEAQQASAILLQKIYDELAMPRLRREHLEVQQREHIAAAERERQRAKIAAELERAKRPIVWASAGWGIMKVQERDRLPSDDESGPGP